ncbi:MAG: AbiV family abortive infection protein [Chloroflexi bacterium]|nr:AbiV family abortive infection protein [Chloroflexota bacterium]
MSDSGGARTEISEATQRGLDVVLAHAEDLLAGARLLAPYPNLAFHLAVLSLEEVGRSSLIVMEEVARRDDEGGRLRHESEDHVRKLFWAFWGPSFGREVITGDQIRSFQDLAQEVHEKRQRGLYVDPEGSPPRDAISSGEAENVIGLAAARLGMARASKWGPLDDDRAALVRWFMDATADPETRRQISSRGSMEKLAEIGNVPDWVAWLRTKIEAGQRRSIELAEQELAREAPSDAEQLEPKWRFKMRLVSGSHSIRARPLTWWNGISGSIKFHPVTTDRQQLVVEMILPKRVPVAAVWYTGLGLANRIVLALNIGATVFFWWYMPEHISRYYDELTDVETNAGVVVERTPALRLDWGHLALTQDELARVALCFGALPHRDEPEKGVAFDHYLTGLGFLAKTDVFMQFEANAFEHFYLALKEATRIYGDWDGMSPFAPSFERVIAEHLHEEPDRAKFRAAGDKIDTGAQRELRVDFLRRRDDEGAYGRLPHTQTHERGG